MSEDLTVIRPAVPLTSDANQQPLPVATLIEGFEIQGVIGVGGFGIVYKAWDAMLQRQVALKEYLPAALAVRMSNGTATGTVKVRDTRHSAIFDAGLNSFINEARLLAQFDHAALVKVYRFWEMAGTAYMVMPLYQGITLKQYVENRAHPITENQLVYWLGALTEALEVMHAQQCYHRDISPENIIIQEGTGLPILLDFGAARRAIGSVSQPFTVILKASYAPIEQYAEVPSMTQGPWTDVYALAAVAHFLITGKTPPPSVGRLVNDSYMPLHPQSQLLYSPHVRLTIDRALAVQPHERTACMQSFRHGLQCEPSDVLALFDLPENIEHETQHAPLVQGIEPSTLTVGPSDKPNRLKWFAALGLIAFLLLCTVLFVPTDLSVTAPAPEARPEAGPDDDRETPEPTPPGIEAAFQAVITQADYALTIQMAQPVLKIGEDLLRFDVQSPISGFVAVYVRASDHSLIQLLPNVRVPALAITANIPLTLPPPNEPIQAAGPAGKNQFLVVVSEQARSYTHLNFVDHYGFGLIQADNKTGSAPVPLLEGTSPCSNIDCKDALAAAWFSVEEVD